MATYLGGERREGNPGSVLPAMYYQPLVVSPSPLHVELIPDRVFVGGFTSNTVESDLRSIFEKFGTINEVKIIRNPDGQSKGYAFITFETEEEAQSVRQQPTDKFEHNGRRLNIGPAMRKVALTARPADYSMVAPQYQIAPQSQNQWGNGNYSMGYALSTDGMGQQQWVPVLIPPTTPQSAFYSPSPFVQYPYGSPTPRSPQHRVMVSPLSPASSYMASPASGHQNMTSETQTTRTPTKAPSILTQQADVFGQTTPSLAAAGHPLTPLSPLTPSGSTHVPGLRWQRLENTPPQRPPQPGQGLRHHQYHIRSNPYEGLHV